MLNNNMQCPNCSNPLQESKKYEVDIDYCPTCKGVWLDRGEIDKIANMQSRYEEEHYQKYHRDQRDYDDDYYGSGRIRRRGRRDYDDDDDYDDDYDDDAGYFNRRRRGRRGGGF
ncbi:MAG TPA: zf-TFIIB domain-containing protein, partial [Nitrososphaeraceae archaeon]|nr:zf-TFIIB domain-containing protein [Nitrososphaeraceae archaeon]